MTPPPATADVPAIEAVEAATTEPAAPADPRLMAHAYDGIREYDNPLPGWWRAIFWGSIVFAALYGAYFHIARWGSTPQEHYRVALLDYEAQREVRDRAEAASVSEAALARRAADPSVVASGRAIFAIRCASCHTPDGRGLIGPNLTDEYQVHGSSRMDIFNTVRRGVPGTAMLAWGEQMSPVEVITVAAFAISLRGTNVEGGKAREGLPVGPFPVEAN